MNITCEQCGKRYKMKAQQTKKAFKTRCKRCSNVIIVRPEEHESPVVAQAQSAAPAESSVPTWYAVINGQQTGPFSKTQISDYLSEGSLDGESFVWCDGMANWEPLAQLSELANLIVKQSTPAPVTSAPVLEDVAKQSSMPQAELQVEQYPSQPQVAEASSQKVASSTPEPALSMGIQIGHNRNLLDEVKSQTPATVEAMFSSEGTADQAGNAASELSNQRNENSVLFSLDSIDGMGAASVAIHNAPVSSSRSHVAAKPIVTNTGGSEGSGLIDLSALSSIRSSVDGSGASGPVPINLTAGVKKVGGSRSLTNRSTDLKTIALAVCSTALVVILGFIGYQQFLKPPAVQRQPISLGQTKGAVSPLVTKQVKSTLVTEKAVTSTTPVSSTISNTSVTKSSSTKALSTEIQKKSTRSVKSKPKTTRAKSKRKKSSSSSKSKRQPSKRKTRRSSTSKSRKSEASSLLSNLKGGKRSGGGKDLSAITGGSKPKQSGPKKPSKKSIQKAMSRVNLKNCLSRDPALKGKGFIRVKVKVVSSGAIKMARVLNSPFKSSPVGACLEREVRRQRVPPFTNRDVSFTYPFRN